MNSVIEIEKDVHEKMTRQMVKAVNLGLMYGMNVKANKWPSPIRLNNIKTERRITDSTYTKEDGIRYRRLEHLNYKSISEWEYNYKIFTEKFPLQFILIKRKDRKKINKFFKILNIKLKNVLISNQTQAVLERRKLGVFSELGN